MLPTPQELITQITLIREKASEAEAIVKTITKDIQRLDVAKRNLTLTMTTVKRWTMLSTCDEAWMVLCALIYQAKIVQAHDQLQELLPTKRYKSIANSLSVNLFVSCLSLPLKLTINPDLRPSTNSQLPSGPSLRTRQSHKSSKTLWIIKQRSKNPSVRSWSPSKLENIMFKCAIDSCPKEQLRS